jgi:RNA polymerase sigma-70 factor, ECF subfamily
MYDNEELACLLAEAKKGNEQALGDILMQLRPWMRWQAEGLLGQRLRARVDGSDIVQDVFCRAIERFGQFDGNSVPQLRAWVEEILWNIVRDCLRRQLAGKRDAGREEHDEDRVSALIGRDTTPSQAARENEQQARLIAALQRLPEKQRLVFHLRYFAEQPFAEVARRLSLTEGNARQLWGRASKSLLDELG